MKAMKPRLTLTGEVAHSGTWDSYGSDAEHERGQLVEPFHAWVIQKRGEVERSLHNNRRHNARIAPFARLALDAAPTPAQCGAVVYEFATGALDALELQAQLDLLNVYYFEAVSPTYDCGLTLADGNAASARELWQWWQREQEDGDSPTA